MKQTITFKRNYNIPFGNYDKCNRLSCFTIEDLDNETTFQTIRNLLTRLDYEQGIK